METKNSSKLVGPRAHERESKLEPEDVRLADGRPLYYALLANPEALVLLPGEAREARQRLFEIISAAPDKVLACQGKTLEEARAILKSAKAEKGEEKE